MSDQGHTINRHQVRSAGQGGKLALKGLSQAVRILLTIVAILAAIAAYEGVTHFVSKETDKALTVSVSNQDLPTPTLPSGGFTTPNSTTP